MNEIDLGQTPEQGPALATPAQDSEPPEPTYPQVTLSGGPELHQLPTVGKSVIKHKIIRKEVDHQRKGKHKHSITMQLHSIKPMSKPKRNNPAADEEAMEILMSGKGRQG
jgi:hypothetical protein